MKKTTLLSLLALLIICFNSCKKETVDVTHLLSTIPSSTSGVIVFNMEEMLKDAGCKVKGHEITPGPEVTAMLNKTGAIKSSDFKMLFDGDTGIEPKGAAIFYDSNRAFLTFALYDVNKFTQYVEQKKGDSFTNENGVKVCGNVAVKDAQAWVLLTGGKKIDPDAIHSYASLSDNQSFLVTPMGEKLLVSEDDIRGWAMINVFTNELLSRGNRNMVSLGLGIFFEDAESVRFSVEFSKGELEMEAQVLNSKGKPAKYLLPSEKVDTKVLEALGSNCDAMMAFTLNQKLIKKFQQLGTSFGGAMFGDLGNMFKNVEGTVGLIGCSSDGEESFQGIVETKGEVNQELRNTISRFLAPVSQDGKYLRFSKGEVNGNLPVAECADQLKGSCLGFVFDARAWDTSGYGDVPVAFKYMAVAFKPESGSLELEVELKTADPSENALITCLKTM